MVNWQLHRIAQLAESVEKLYVAPKRDRQQLDFQLMVTLQQCIDVDLMEGLSVLVS